MELQRAYLTFAPEFVLVICPCADNMAFYRCLMDRPDKDGNLVYQDIHYKNLIFGASY